MNEDVKYRGIRAGQLKPGDVMLWSTKPSREIEEVEFSVTKSQYYPHRPYKVIRVRFKGETEFTWQRGISSWACIVAK